jgi:hypothetical protein
MQPPVTRQHPPVGRRLAVGVSGIALRRQQRPRLRQRAAALDRHRVGSAELPQPRGPSQPAAAARRREGLASVFTPASGGAKGVSVAVLNARAAGTAQSRHGRRTSRAGLPCRRHSVPLGTRPHLSTAILFIALKSGGGLACGLGVCSCHDMVTLVRFLGGGAEGGASGHVGPSVAQRLPRRWCTTHTCAACYVWQLQSRGSLGA